MGTKNEIFENVINYLIQTGRIKDQKDFSAITGITEATISRIINDKVKEPSKSTLRRLNAAFDYIFNMDYLEGKSSTMLAYNASHVEPSSIASEPPIAHVPTWADTLTEILSKQIKENELLNSELRQSLKEVATLRDDLRTLLKSLNPSRDL